MTGRIRYSMKILSGNNDLRKKILELMSTEKLAWTKLTKKYMDIIRIAHGDLRNLNTDKLKEIAKAWDTQIWKDEVNRKTSRLSMDEERKTEIKKSKFTKTSHHQ